MPFCVHFRWMIQLPSHTLALPLSLFNIGAQAAPKTNKGYLKSSRDATRYYTHRYPQPGRGTCSQYSTFAKRSSKKKTPQKERKTRQRKKKKGKRQTRKRKQWRDLSLNKIPSKSEHHITTHPLPSFFFFPAIHCTSLLFSFWSFVPSYKPESRSPPFLFRLKKPSFFAFSVGGKADLRTMF